MNNIRFEVVGGNPTEEEKLAIYKALYKVYNPERSMYNRPQLRPRYWEFKRN